MVAPVQDMKSLITVEQSAALEADVHIQSNFREADIFSLGLRFFKYGRLDLSLAFFARVLDLNENNAQAYVNIGNIYHKNGDIESAANFWKYAIKIDPACEKAYMNLGNYFYGKKNPEQAISYWIILQTLNPNDPGVFLNLGVAYEEKNNLLAANFYYEKFIQKSITGRTPDGYTQVVHRISKIKKAAKNNFKIGLKCQSKGEYLYALKAYIKAVEAYPNHIKANLNAGSICYMNEKFEDAVKFWVRVLYLDPGNQKNLVNIAIAYDKIEQFSYAYCLYKRFLNEQHDETSFESLKIEERVKVLEEILGEKNSHYSSHYSKAEDSIKKKDYFNAYFEYKNCSMLKSDSEELMKKLDSIKEVLYPERNLIKRYVEMGKKALNKLELVTAVDFFRLANNLGPLEHEEIEIKTHLAKCAKMLKKMQG